MFCWIGCHSWGKPFDVSKPYYNGGYLDIFIYYFYTFNCKRRCYKCNRVEDFSYDSAQYDKISKKFES